VGLIFRICEPADGTRAATEKGISARPAGSSTVRLHQSRDRAEGATARVRSTGRSGRSARPASF